MSQQTSKLFLVFFCTRWLIVALVQSNTLIQCVSISIPWLCAGGAHIAWFGLNWSQKKKYFFSFFKLFRRSGKNIKNTLNKKKKGGKTRKHPNHFRWGEAFWRRGGVYSPLSCLMGNWSQSSTQNLAATLFSFCIFTRDDARWPLEWSWSVNRVNKTDSLTHWLTGGLWLSTLKHRLLNFPTAGICASSGL